CLPYLVDVVCGDPCQVNTIYCNHFCKVRSRSLDHPFIILLDYRHTLNVRHTLYPSVEQLALERQERLCVRLVRHGDLDGEFVLIRLDAVLLLGAFKHCRHIIKAASPFSHFCFRQIECQHAAIVCLRPFYEIAYLCEQDFSCDFKCLLSRYPVFLIKVNVHCRSNWFFARVYELDKPRKAECNVPLLSASKVECSEGHLGSRLADRLCSHDSDRFSGLGKRPVDQVEHFLHHFFDTFFA